MSDPDSSTRVGHASSRPPEAGGYAPGTILAETRNARSIAHPNVCRVYDAGEVEGRRF
jgi:hypothetical protein